MKHIVHPARTHFMLFFDDAWRSLLDHVSYGHDIEGSWLMVEAAEVAGDTELLAQCREAATRMAEAVYRRGIDADGGLLYEGGPRGVVDDRKSWWVQAEAMVGFTNAYQLSGDERFFCAAYLRIFPYGGEYLFGACREEYGGGKRHPLDHSSSVFLVYAV